VTTPGGGGYGAPDERDRALLNHDIRNEKLTVEKLNDDYGFTIERK
jgi:N-methylhydantoinase B